MTRTPIFRSFGLCIIGLILVLGGNVINDAPGATGGASHGVRRFRGLPARPKWSTETALTGGAQTTIQLQLVVSGLSNPVYVTSARDNTNRLFIVEQGGIIKVLQPGSSTPTEFLNITTRVLSGGERGLLGLAFHPSYKSNGRFFVYYTRQTDGALRVAEYHVSANPNVADTTEIVMLEIPHPTNANHNGGTLQFGPDGYLYLGPGDGGAGNDPPNNAQNINSLLGKILRVDIDHPNGAIPYSSPSTNPFFGPTPGGDEIYVTGMRNPYRFSFDRGTGQFFTGQLYVGDVGQGAWEEIDIVTLGGNYGWRVFEGFHCTGNDPGICSAGATNCGSNGYTCPIAEYGHTLGRCSITGGYVYRGALGTVPAGAYIYADFCTGEIFMLNGAAQSLLLDTARNISSFGEDEAGELYVAGLGGTLERIVNNTAATLRIDSVIPPAGRTSGGQQVKLTGAFVDLSSVMVGGVSASFVFSNGTSEVTVTTPPHTSGAVNIDLTPTSGSTYSRGNAFAYLPTTFTDNMLVAGVTTAKAQHIIELRQAVDALRAVAGLWPAPWTDPTLLPTNTLIKAVHILELRSYLEDAAGRLGYPAGSYSDPTLSSGFVIKLTHIEDLRQRIRTVAG
jgi:glucose/arabinose dehydrogenase